MNRATGHRSRRSLALPLFAAFVQRGRDSRLEAVSVQQQDVSEELEGISRTRSGSAGQLAAVQEDSVEADSDRPSQTPAAAVDPEASISRSSTNSANDTLSFVSPPSTAEHHPPSPSPTVSPSAESDITPRPPPRRLPPTSLDLTRSPLVSFEDQRISFSSPRRSEREKHLRPRRSASFSDLNSAAFSYNSTLTLLDVADETSIQERRKSTETVYAPSSRAPSVLSHSSRRIQGLSSFRRYRTSLSPTSDFSFASLEQCELSRGLRSQP